MTPEETLVELLGNQQRRPPESSDQTIPTPYWARNNLAAWLAESGQVQEDTGSWGQTTRTRSKHAATSHIGWANLGTLIVFEDCLVCVKSPHSPEWINSVAGKAQSAG
jgi:hypothetical protein